MAELDLERAARIGLLAEVLLHEVSAHRRDDHALLSSAQLARLRETAGNPDLDLWLEALNLIGEGGVIDVAGTEQGGLLFTLQPNQPMPLPATYRQALRQQGIPIEVGEQLFRQWRGMAELGEADFVRQCLREQKPPVLSRYWQPGPFCLAGLRQRGVSERFVADLIPEFILLYNERRSRVLSLDLEFFRFASVRWGRYVNAFDESTDLRPLPERWEPSLAVRRELNHRGIDVLTINRRLPEFRLSKRESNHLSRHWGAEFVRFCTDNS